MLRHNLMLGCSVMSAVEPLRILVLRTQMLEDHIVQRLVQALWQDISKTAQFQIAMQQVQ